ncbi:alpha-(1,3)-fucosyltransferase 10-like [Pectinophora gossypiella]|uniref:alpha-(1,3)-fucosyltransferase 10-like n=1 Tax=Pectinophora gossypiella TaxID=13191 RepID=UPI00214E4B15|nr:alpha-(1,3)-fucosyltransferase 10-like [Pectinophora gossypiella]
MDESPISNTILLYEKALNLFNLSSTFSRHSDTPIPLHMLRKLKNIRSKQYFVNTLTKNALLHDNAPVVFFNRDCHTLTEREAYVRELKKYIQIDSYGDCLHNKDFPFELDEKNDDMYGRKLLRYLARYKFIIAIENAVCIDYVTEKFWRAIEIGVVPIYYGSPSIRDWLPNNKSAILLEDFPTPKLLSQHLHYLLQNDTAYEEYLEHKTLGLISNQNIVNEIKARPYQIRVEREEEFLCLVCRRIHDTNDTQVNIVTKDHYNCQTPGPTALSLSANPSSMWDEIRKRAELKVDSIYKEMEQSYSHLRKSNTNWDTQEIFPFYLKLANVPMS